MLPTPSYRADIDGLRAIAVLLVVLYHYGLAQPAGGFVGVDVFFVVSGYLITSIVAKETAENRFSIAGFYGRRIRRIMPALLTVIIVTLTFGQLILMPGDYASLGWQSAAAAIGISNFYFLWNTGYFDQSADLLPLLHTWSLGVEEQFYLIWPVVLVAISRFIQSRAPIILALFAIIASSFAAACVLIVEDPQAAFYLPYARAWELALGALLVFAPKLSESWAQAAAPLGLTLIGASAFFLSSSDPFPGMNALAPCLGAVLVVWPSQKASATARALSFGPLRQIGLASYSLYLWHWPVLVLYRHYNRGEMPSDLNVVLLLATSVGLAFLSLKFIETPFRRMRLRDLRTIVVGTAATCVVALSGFALAAAEGLPSRLDSVFRAMENREVMWSWDCPYAGNLGELGKVCVFGEAWETSTDRILLWGDSHAIHFVPILDAVLKPGQSAVIFHACPASVGASYHRNRIDLPSYRSQCIESRARVLDFLRSTPNIKTVVLASLWQAHYLSIDGGSENEISAGTNFYNAIAETLDAIQAPGRKALLVSNFARFSFDPLGCVFADSSLLRTPCPPDTLLLTRSAYDEQSAEIDQTFMRLASERLFVDAIFPGRKMCESSVCMTRINGEFIYGDNSHIRRNLSKEAFNVIANLIELKGALN